MLSRSRIAGCLVSLGLLLCAANPAAAADWDRFPDLLPGQRVGIKKLYDGPRYYELRSCYRNFDSEVDAAYYGALVDVTDREGKTSPTDGDADPYAEALAEAWADDSQLDSDNHVLVVLGLANRSIGVHPGDKWADLGFEGETVDQTIEVSEFADHMASKDYVNAMCSVLDAIDIRLTDLKSKMDRRIETLRGEIPELQENIRNRRTELDERFGDEHPFGDSVDSLLEEALAKTKRAESNIEDDATTAVTLVDEARSNLEKARGRLDSYDRDIQRLEEVETQLADLRTTIENRPDAGWDDPQAALSKLDQCEQQATEFRRTHEGQVADIRACRQAAEKWLEAADTRYYYLMTVLPAGGAGLAIALLAWFLVGRIRRRRRTLELLTPELEEWERRLDRTARELNHLQRTHPRYFDRHDQLWEGESADLDRATADAVNRMCLLETRGRELVTRARDRREEAHRLAVGPLETALRELRETAVEFEPGDRDPRHRLALPVCQPYRQEASALLGDLEQAHRRACIHLADVDEAYETLTDSADRAGQTSAEATEAVEQRRELNLPADHLEEALGPALDAWRQAHRLRHRDPRRAGDLFDEAADRFDQVGERGREGNEIVRRIEGPIKQRGKNLRSAIRRRSGRSQGQSSTSVPTTELESTARDAERIVELVDDGNVDEAHALLETLETRLDDLEDGLELREHADEQLRDRLDDLAARRESLQQRIGDLRRTLSRLAPEGARGAFREESRHVGQLQSVLSRVTKRLDEARNSIENDRPLAGADQLTTARRALDAVEAFVSEFDDVERRVPRARETAQSLAADCESFVEHIGQRTDRTGVALGLRELVDRARDEYRTLREQMDQSSINALRAQDRLEPLRSRLEFLYGELGTDIEAHEAAETWANSLREDLDELDRGGQLSSAVREVLADIDERVDALLADLDGETGGRELLARTRAVSRAVGRAKKLADGHLETAVAANHLQACARSRLESVDGRAFGFGESADCQQARQRLTEAESAMESGDDAGALPRLEAAIAAVDDEAVRAASAAEARYRRLRTETLSPSDLDDAPSFSELGRSPNWGGRGSSPGHISSSSAIDRN